MVKTGTRFDFMRYFTKPEANYMDRKITFRPKSTRPKLIDNRRWDLHIPSTLPPYSTATIPKSIDENEETLEYAVNLTTVAFNYKREFRNS